VISVVAVSLNVAIGVVPGVKRKSSGAYGLRRVKTCSKMGHSAKPKGRSSVGRPSCSQLVLATGGIIVTWVARREGKGSWIGRVCEREMDVF